MLWPDTFTNYFHPHIGQAAVEVLEQAGWRVEIPAAPLCCGLTWISTGQLATAKRVLSRTVSSLAEHVQAGGYVVGLEPSCTAVFRADAAELFPDDEDVHRLADHTVTLAELLTEHSPGWEPPPLARRVPSHGMQALTCHGSGRSWMRRLPPRLSLRQRKCLTALVTYVVSAGTSTSASARPRIRPAGPTNGLPCRSSASPGCSPTSIKLAGTGPAPNTACVACS